MRMNTFIIFSIDRIETQNVKRKNLFVRILFTLYSTGNSKVVFIIMHSIQSRKCDQLYKIKHLLNIFTEILFW